MVETSPLMRPARPEKVVEAEAEEDSAVAVVAVLAAGEAEADFRKNHAGSNLDF